MKRSEGWKKLVAKGWQEGHADLCLIGLEELGIVTWDPEGEPMAERLVAEGGRLYAEYNGCAGDAATQAEAGLAADLYNRRGAIASVISELRTKHAASQAGRPHVWPGPARLADRLEGKE